MKFALVFIALDETNTFFGFIVIDFTFFRQKCVKLGKICQNMSI